MADLRATIRQLSSAFGFRLNTDLGQHFLADEEVLESIVEAAHIQKEDTIVEIGSGLGILTKELALRAARVMSIELDERWIPIAQQYAGKNATAKLEFVHGNALKVPLPTEPYKIVANIPYHITSPLLRHAFLESTQTPTSLTLLIQREVAEKICDTEDAGILTIMVALFGRPRLVRLVPPGCFFPPPKVDSGVLHIECFEKPLADRSTLEELFRLVKVAFAQKRKMLSNSLGSLPEGKELLEKAHIDGSRRPQTLSVEEWIALAQGNL